MSFPLLPTTFYLPETFERSRQPLIDRVQKISSIMNRKTTGEYRLGEINTSQTIFGSAKNNAPVFRTTLNFGALPNAGTTSVAHNIDFTDEFRFLKIYGAGTNTTTLEAIPLPYVSSTALASHIEVNVDSTNVNVVTGADYSGYDAIFVLEYTKQ